MEMSRTSSFNTSSGNTSLMNLRGTIGALVLVIALLAFSGCTQPTKTTVQVPPAAAMNSTPAPVFIPSPALPGQGSIVTARVTILAVTSPAGQVPSPAPSPGNPATGAFVRYTGPEYSLDYPAAWSANSTTLPLREYHHSQYDCLPTLAYNLNEERRMFYSPDNRTFFYTEVVNTQRDVWPRSVSGRIVYEDIFNAVLGNPESCANLEGNDAFTIAGISQVPLTGVYFPGVRVDFSRINATGFAEGSGTAYVVTGKNHRGVFTFYSASPGADSRVNLADAILDSLHLDSEF
jgi:hypothetical protein